MVEAPSSLVAVLTEDPRLVPALLTLVAVLLGVAIALLVVLLRRTSRDPATPLVPKIEALAGAQERAESLVQE